jgi:type VI secretion system secreted protein Hcp
MQVGGGGGAGKPIVDDVVLAKYIDKASPRLLFACLKGEHFIEAILTVAMINGAETFDKVVIKMTDVLVTSINSGVNETYGGIIENVALNFAKVEFIYTPQTLGGSGDAQIDFTWNLERNTDEGVSW